MPGVLAATGGVREGDVDRHVVRITHDPVVAVAVVRDFFEPVCCQSVGIESQTTSHLEGERKETVGRGVGAFLNGAKELW